MSLIDSFEPRKFNVCGVVHDEAEVHLFFHGGTQGRLNNVIAAGIAVDLGMYCKRSLRAVILSRLQYFFLRKICDPTLGKGAFPAKVHSWLWGVNRSLMSAPARSQLSIYMQTIPIMVF